MIRFSLLFKTILAVLIVISISVFSWLEYQHFKVTPLSLDSNGYNFTVDAGSNLSKVSRQISQQKLTNLPPIYLDIYGRLEGRAHLIKTGEYHIKAGTT